MKNRECVSCIKRKTPYCPTSIECMATDDMPYYRNRMMLLKENQELKEKIEKIREIVENSDWRLDDVHDLIDGYDEIAKIII